MSLREFRAPNGGPGPHPFSFAHLPQDFAVVLLHRDFYASDCRRQVQQVKRRYDEFEARDAVVISVLPESESRAEEWASQYGLPFPVVADADAELGERFDQPRRYGLLGKVHDVLGRMPTTVLLDLRKREPDPVYVYRGESPADRPAVDDILAQIDRLLPVERRDPRGLGTDPESTDSPLDLDGALSESVDRPREGEGRRQGEPAASSPEPTDAQRESGGTGAEESTAETAEESTAETTEESTQQEPLESGGGTPAGEEEQSASPPEDVVIEPAESHSAESSPSESQPAELSPSESQPAEYSPTEELDDDASRAPESADAGQEPEHGSATTEPDPEPTDRKRVPESEPESETPTQRETSPVPEKPEPVRTEPDTGPDTEPSTEPETRPTSEPDEPAEPTDEGALEADQSEAGRPRPPTEPTEPDDESGPQTAAADDEGVEILESEPDQGPESEEVGPQDSEPAEPDASATDGVEAGLETARHAADAVADRVNDQVVTADAEPAGSEDAGGTDPADTEVESGADSGETESAAGVDADTVDDPASADAEPEAGDAVSTPADTEPEAGDATSTSADTEPETGDAPSTGTGAASEDADPGPAAPEATPSAADSEGDATAAPDEPTEAGSDPGAADVVVREATPADRMAVVQVIHGALLDLEVDVIDAALADGDVLVAADGDWLVGALVLRDDPVDDGLPEAETPADARHIETLAVRRERRRQGIGTALVDAAVEREGAVTADFRTGLRDFWSEADFDIHRTEDRLWGERRD